MGGRAWTLLDDERLRLNFPRRDVPVPYLAARMDRTSRGVRMRAAALGLRRGYTGGTPHRDDGEWGCTCRPGARHGTGRGWTTDEILRLEILYEGGDSVLDIARALRRTTNAVHLKASRLRLRRAA